MKSFIIAFFDIPIQILPIHKEVISFFNDYLSNDSPIIKICMTEEDIELEKEIALQHYVKKEKINYYPRYQLEIRAILRRIANILPDHDAFLFHSSAVVYDSKAYLFSAPHGTGKTTHSLKWLKLLPGSYILNGDKPFIIIRKEHIYVCGTPWKGKEKLGRNSIQPLEAICIIERGQNNQITNISPEDAFLCLINQMFIPENNTLKTIQLLQYTLNHTKLYRLLCNMEDKSALISIGAMVDNDV